MKIRLNKTLKSVLKIILSAGALAFVFTKIDIQEVINIYRSSNITLILLAIFLFVLSKFIAAFRFRKFLQQINIHLYPIFNLKLYLLGMFYNLFLPGGIGGDGYKIYLLNKNYDVKAGRIFWAVFFDRVSGMMALFCLAVLFSLALNLQNNFNYKSYVWIMFPLALVTFYFFLKKFFRYLTTYYGITTLQSFLVQITQTICAWGIFMAIGAEGALFEYIFLFLISSIVATLPITIGGVGSREITFLYGSQILGLDASTSIAMSLMFYLITAIVSLSGLYFSITGLESKLVKAEP